MGYGSETAKVRELPQVMKYVTGEILDVGCGHDKVTPEAIGFDGRFLPGVDIVGEHESIWEKVRAFRKEAMKDNHFIDVFDTVFSSHFLEHLPDQYQSIITWWMMLKKGGHLVLYLPDGDKYNNQENEEHMVDMKYDPFMFWVRRAFCGFGKDFKGNHLRSIFEIVEHGVDFREDCYSFYCVLRKV